MAKDQLKTVVQMVDGIQITIEAPDADTVLKHRHTLQACLADDICASAHRHKERGSGDAGTGS